MKLKLISHSVLMDESWSHVGDVAESGHAHQQQVASRILDDTSRWRHWEAEHGGFMHQIASQSAVLEQVAALRRVSFSMIHRKALFEYLRDHAQRGAERRELIQHFHGQKSYSQAVVAEHGNYQRSVASLICIEHIGATLLLHQAFDEPLRRYEHRYSEYFRSYCDSYLAPATEDGDGSDSMRILLPHLKRDVLDERARLLALPAAPAPGTHATR